jgi:hypothetical protein
VSGHALDAKLYIARTPLTTEWLVSLLRHLWEHGVHFSAFTPEVARWEGQVQALYPAIGRPPVTLAQEIADIVARGAGTMQLWDKTVSMTLALDPNLTAAARVLKAEVEAEVEALPRRAYGTIGLFVDTVYLQQDDLVPRGTASLPASGHLVTPSQQVFIAFAHWFAVLAQQAHAAFGFGYDPGDDLADEDAFVEESDEAIEAALARRQMPTLGAWLARERVTYVSSTLVTPELLARWISAQRRWVHQVPGGGVVSIAPLQLYERGEAQAQLQLGDMALSARRLREAEAHYQRARTIFEANGDAHGAFVSRSNLKRLAQIE